MKPTRSQIDAMRALPAAIKAANNAHTANCKHCHGSAWLDGPEPEDGRHCPYCEEIDCDEPISDKEPT